MLSAIFPTRCGLCGLIATSGVCEDCLAEFQPIESPVEVFSAGPVDFAICLYHYQGRASQAVRRLKYERVTSLADPLARLMATKVRSLAIPRYDLVCPVPIHWRRLCWRGFNQADLLARGLASRSQRRALLRIRATRPQVRLNPQERATNLVGAFRASPSVHGQSVLLVDDVLTSGSTAKACAQALKAAGVKQVGILTLTKGG